MMVRFFRKLTSLAGVGLSERCHGVIPRPQRQAQDECDDPIRDDDEERGDLSDDEEPDRIEESVRERLPAPA